MHFLSPQTLRSLFLVYLTAKVVESALPNVEQQVSTKQSNGKSGHHAVVISDLKPDDTMALAMAVKQYDSIDVIVSGIRNKKGGILTVQKALEKMLKPDPTNAKMQYIIADDGAQAAGHEHSFPQTPFEHSIKIITFGDYFASFRGAALRPGGQKPVMLIQMAPFPAHLVDGLIHCYRSRLNGYLLIAMFNAGQGSEEDKLNFLTNLQEKLSDKKSGKEVPFLFSSNWVSVSDREIGSTVPLRDLIGILPTEVLESAAMDPFHSKQLSKAATEISLIRNPPDLTKLEPGEKPPPIAKIDPSTIKQSLIAMSEAIKTLATWTNAKNDQVPVNKPPPAWFVDLVRELTNANSDLADHSTYAIIKIADALKKLENPGEKQPLEEGQALRCIVYSARAKAGKAGRQFRNELEVFLLQAIDLKLSISRRLKSVLAGLSSEFPVEACDGIHYASWNRVLLPLMQRNPEQPFEQLLKTPPKPLTDGYFEIGPEKWVIAKQFEKTSADKDVRAAVKDAQAGKKSQALILWKADLLDPQDSPFNPKGLTATFFEDISKVVVHQTESFRIADLDPFGIEVEHPTPKEPQVFKEYLPDLNLDVANKRPRTPDAEVTRLEESGRGTLHPPDSAGSTISEATKRLKVIH